jgi:hypothetical protein
VNFGLDGQITELRSASVKMWVKTFFWKVTVLNLAKFKESHAALAGVLQVNGISLVYKN